MPTPPLLVLVLALALGVSACGARKGEFGHADAPIVNAGQGVGVAVRYFKQKPKYLVLEVEFRNAGDTPAVLRTDGTLRNMPLVLPDGREAFCGIMWSQRTVIPGYGKVASANQLKAWLLQEQAMPLLPRSSTFLYVKYDILPEMASGDFEWVVTVDGLEVGGQAMGTLRLDSAALGL